MPMRHFCQEMSNASFRHVCYFLLIVVDCLLKLIYGTVHYCIYVLKSLVYYLFGVNMIEYTKKRKRNPNAQTEETVVQRGIIDANWRKLLANSLLMDKGNEKPVQKDQNQQYTGTFRRARKKKANDPTTSNSVHNNLETLQINNVSSKLDNSVFLNATGIKNNVTISNREMKSPSCNKDKKGSLTKFIAMDCEMVGIGYDGGDHMLARVSLVNKFGDCIYDKFVKAREEVKDYRTDISGIRKEDLINGEDFTVVQKEVAEILRGRILIGHSLKNDLSVLFLSHPKRNIRDTSKYKPFRKITKGSTPSLKRLAKEILGIDIQHGEHSSVEDAKAAMQLYCTVAKTWERMMSEKRGYNKKMVDE